MTRPAKQDLVSDLVNDALAVLAVLAGPDAPERDAAAADALGLLALVAGQDVEPAEGSDGTDGRWRIARKVAAGPGDQHRGPAGPAYPQEQVQAPGRVPRACGRRAGDRADHRLRDDDGRRGGQHRRGERGEDGLPATGSTTAGMAPPAPPAARPTRRIGASGTGARPHGTRSAAGTRAAARTRTGRGRRRVQVRLVAWRSTATRPTAAGRPAPPTAMPGTTP